MQDGFNISRRRLLAGAGALTFIALAGGRLTMSRAEAQTPNLAEVALGPWVRIAADGKVTILFAAAEMGQGVSTALPMILAEEMDADWQMVISEQVSGGSPEIYGPRTGPFLYTAGSMAITGYFEIMRRAGAGVRRTLVQMAAAELGVPPESLATEAGRVIHAASGRSLTYGEVAQLPLLAEELPEVTEADLKTPDQWRIIGQSLPRLDIPAKSRGQAQYSIDVRVPGMAYAVQILAPVEGETPLAVEDVAARALPGVIDIISLQGSVNILAETLQAALAARDLVVVTWSETSPFRDVDSDAVLAGLIQTAGDMAQASTIWHSQGDLAAAEAGAAQVFTASYATEPVYHAQMEPLCAIAHVDEDGKGAEFWLGTQSQTVTLMTAAAVLETTPDRLRFHAMTMGGGFGRRTVFARDLLRDALLLSRTLKRPVKLIWTREDDVKNGWFRPIGGHHIAAMLNADGDLIGLRHRIAAPSILAFAMPPAWANAENRDPPTMEATECHDYDIPNLVAEHVITPRQSRIAAWRGIGAGPNGFVRECFIDELAHHTGQSPVDYRRRLLAASPRGLGVLDEVLRMSDFGNAPEGRAHGLSFAGYRESRGAGVAEVSVDQDSGEITVHRFWAAIDAGIVIHPDNLVAQVEGGILFGISGLLRERISIRGGQIEQSNFYDYDLLRMAQMPEVHVSVIASTAAPSGVGEIGVPMTGGAVSNAVFALTGTRLRQMPFQPR